MKTTQVLVGCLTLVLVWTSLPLLATANEYDDALKEGDENRRYKRFDLALESYEEAVEEAANETQTALALSKKALVYAYDKEECAKAENLIKEALGLDADSIGHVFALQAKAYCQMTADEDYGGAERTLKKALALEGIAWSHPQLTLALGDCYRFSNQPDEAIDMYEKVDGFESATDPVKGVAQLNIGITYHYNLGKPKKAMPYYEKASMLNHGLRYEVEDHLSKIDD